jgi:hypothetical protein
MASLAEYLKKVDFEDTKFVGTIALRNEELTLPDGSKMALGIDDGHWVLVYQQKAGGSFQVFECDWKTRKIFLDKKPGGNQEFKTFRSLLKSIISHTQVDDLVTILPPSA